jgi:hypothetical protein
MKDLISFPMRNPTDGENETPPRKFGIVPTISTAAKLLDVTSRTVRNWRQQGCPGFTPDGRVDVDQVARWADEKREERYGPTGAREEKLREEIRKLRIANDAREGRLVERAWVAERIQRAAGELNGLRSKWEAEMPVLFAATNGDIPECRTILRGIMDEVFSGLQGMAKHFEEESP